MMIKFKRLLVRRGNPKRDNGGRGRAAGEKLNFTGKTLEIVSFYSFRNL